MLAEGQGKSMTEVCDFANSYFHFEIDIRKQPSITMTQAQPLTQNQVRIPIEARCVITETSGAKVQYLLTASCKTELVNVPRDMWTQPNADFCIVVCDDDFLILKRWDCQNKQMTQESSHLAKYRDRQTGRTREAWASHKLDVVLTEGKVLTSAGSILAATLNNQPLVSRTIYRDTLGRDILIEYPVKTINVSERDGFYQVDTGPVALPWGDKEGEIAGFHLAYVAHNTTGWVEFLVNTPTQVAPNVHVHHYSHVHAISAENLMIEPV